LSVLIKGLPSESLLRTDPEDRSLDRWSVNTELLAQLLEVTSVGVAERRLKDPVKIPRPTHLAKHRKARSTQEAYARGISVLQRTSKGITK
jgi:hypothetical protein